MSKSQINKQRMVEEYENIRLNMKKEGYTESICTISILKANVMALILALPFIIICIVVYHNKWSNLGPQIVEFFDVSSSFKEMILFWLIMLTSFAIHELIHGITWSLFCQNKWKSIHFGIMWSSLTPYCHCKEELKFKGYILGGLMPLFMLGFGVFIISLFTHSIMLFVLSLVNIIGAGGDMLISLMLIKYKNSIIFDHPTECGFIAFTK